MERQLFAAACLLLMFNTSAQDPWVLPGNLGADPNQDFVGTTDEEGLTFRTHDIMRMRLYGSPGPATINGFTGVEQNGYLGISPQPLFFSNTVGPFTRLHLADSINDNTFTYAQPLGFRPWMKNGITFTGNSDQAYIGQRFYGNDSTNLVFQWSDNPGTGTYTPDRLRFIFTSNYTASRDTGARSMEGLEALRMFPVDSFNVNVGIGDFWKAGVFAGSPQDPTERLDVLDGRVRIRQLPTELEADTVEKFVVVNEDGVLGWRPLASLPDNCEWRFQNPASNLNVNTAFGSGGPGCPSRDNNVGIGTNNPNQAKLHVVREPVGTSNVIGEQIRVTGGGNSYTGSNILVTPSSGHFGTTASGSICEAQNANTIYGVLGRSTINNAYSGNEATGVRGASRVQDGASLVRSYGVYGYATTSGVNTNVTNIHGCYGNTEIGVNTTATNAYGVYGRATETTSGSATNMFGVYGVVPNEVDTSFNATRWAGFFEGKLKVTKHAYVNGNVFVTSDAMLKTNIQDMENASAILAELNPKTYSFQEQQHPLFSLPAGTQMGLIAQEVEAVLPNLVTTSVMPAVHDSLGNQTAPSVSYRMLNYMGLIPVLIGATKEQQARIEAQEAVNGALQDQLNEQRQRLDQLEQALALCCTNPADGQQLQTPGDGSEGRMLPDAASERLLTIAPNPFTEQTTVSYTLERGGRAMLLVNGSDGKHLQVLEEGARSAGQYQYVWRTAHLAPGVYYVTLLLDGEPLVKRAVKVR